MSYFLLQSDYNTQIRGSILNVITQDNEQTLHDAELAAQEEMESFLRVQYDVAQIFDITLEPENRSKLIVMYMVDITLYHLHSNITPSNIPEIRETRYNSAMLWLKKVSEGKLSPALPEYENQENPFENGGSQFFYGGSNEKVSERY